MLALRVFVFLGAFLLFSMEPMVGRMLLPAFGGAFHVWTTSLMFFQGVLFLAYAWAHLVAPRIGRAHLALVVLPLVALPPAPGVDLGAHDVPALLLALARAAALPFAALATTSVTAQRWLAGSSLPERERPYGLYATSNVGSLAALLLYALVIEPLVPVSTQRFAWSAGFVAWVASALVAWRVTRPRGARPEPAQAEAAAESSAPASSLAPTPVTPARVASWVLLSAWPSALLMAVTNLIALDAGNVPLVWVVPLALYLGTFVLAFGEPSRVPAPVFRLWPHFAAVALYLFAGGDTGTTWLQVILHLVAFFVIALAAHGELYRERPDATHLTLFYLVMSLGGWLGGAFVALVAPVTFARLWEFPIALLGLALTVLVLRRAALRAWLGGAGAAAIGVSVLLVLTIAAQVLRGLGTADDGRRVLARGRSFYGVYMVTEEPTAWGPERQLVSGATRHGRELMDEPYRRDPLSYYHRRSPLGEVMDRLASRGRPRRIGAIGLGVGATAAYVEPGESLTFFEIDQADVDFARRHFHYLEDCRGACDTEVGDARILLDARAARGELPAWDLLLVDAFAGDAIPTHLLTREAVELDRRFVADDGYLLFHVSNRYYALLPVLARIARTLGVPAAYKRRVNETAIGEDPSEYFLFAPSEAEVEALLPLGWQRVDEALASESGLWTDDHVNTLAALAPDWR